MVEGSFFYNFSLHRVMQKSHNNSRCYARFLGLQLVHSTVAQGILIA